MSEIPATGGYIVGALVVVAGVIRFFFADHKAFDVLGEEIRALRDQQAETRQKLVELEANYNEQRHEKHDYINKYARARVLLSVIDKLSQQCSCGALDNVSELLDRALAEVSD